MDLLTSHDDARGDKPVGRPGGVAIWFGQVKTMDIRRTVVIMTVRDAARGVFLVDSP